MRSRKRSAAGFTLMETLVAFAIFSLSVVAILQTYSLSSKMQARAQIATQTSELLYRLLASPEARLDGPGSIEGNEDGYAWRLRVEPANNGLVTVTADVTDPLGRQETAMTLRWQGELFAGGAAG